MTSPVPAGRRLMILFLVAGLAVIFAASFWYRMEHPSLRVEMRAGGQTPPGMGQNQDMGRVQELMAKMQTDPNDLPTLLELAEAFLSMRAYDRAEAFLNRAKALKPDEPAILRGMGMVHFERKQYDLAAKDFQELLARDADDSIAHYNLGIVLKYYLKRPEEAVRQFQAVRDNTRADSGLRQEAAQELEGK